MEINKAQRKHLITQELEFMNQDWNMEAIRHEYAPIITVFGSSACNSGSPLYSLAEEVGKIIVNAGFTIANGGYTGTMDATAKGARTVGGKVLGVTTKDISKVKPSQYLTKEFCESTLMTRLTLLIQLGSAYLFLPGSTGTLTELVLVWDQAKLGLIPPRPMFLMGSHWQKIFKLMFEEEDALVPRSPWKKDTAVVNNTYIISSIDELKIKFAKLTITE